MGLTSNVLGRLSKLLLDQYNKYRINILLYWQGHLANTIFSSIGSINGNLLTTEAFTFIKVAIDQSVLQPLNDCNVWWLKNGCHRDSPCTLMLLLG